MKKLHIALGGLIAAAVLAPATAHAGLAPYAPLEGTDSSADVIGRNEQTYAKPTLDIQPYAAERTDKKLKFTLGFEDLKQTSYTRRLAGVSATDPETGVNKAELVELRTGANGATAVSVYVIKYDPQSEKSTIKTISCPTAKAYPDYTEDVLTLVLPSSCYRLGDADSVTFQATAASWSASRWNAGPLSDGFKQPDYYDSAYAWWNYSNVQRSAPTPLRLF